MNTKKWEMVRLGDVANLITKGTTPTTLGFNFVETGVSFLKIESISQTGKILTEKIQFITQECHEKFKRSQLQESDILFSIAGALGRVALVKKDILPANINQALAVIRIVNNEICLNYVIYALQSQHIFKQFQLKKQGVAQLNLSLKNISDLQVPLPPLEEQKKIAQELDSIQSLIAKRKEQLEKLDLLVKTKFVEMFGDPVANPIGWEVKPLKQTTTITTGNTPPKNDAENYGNYIEWIKTDNITKNMFLTTAVEYLSEKGAKRGRIVEENTILMACIAGSIKSIGRVAITDRNVSFNQQINAISPKKNIYNIFFLYYLCIFNQKYIQSSISMSLKGILSKGKLEQIKFVVPPIDLQNQFADYVQQVENMKITMQKGLEKLELLHNSKMQEYFE